MRRRLFPLLLCLAMVLAVLPGQAMAATTLRGDTDGNGTVDVTLTVSQGTDDFYKTKQNKRLFKETLSVPYFDLELYDLEGYYYNPDCYTGQTQTAGTKDTAQGVVTTMHVFIWATERFMLGLDETDCGKGQGKIDSYISWTQGPGSSYCNFWEGTNLNYYLDYAFPLGRENWGSTSDQQALSDGMAIDIHMIEDKVVSGSQYSYIKTADGTPDFATVTKGDGTTLTLWKTTSSYGSVTTSATVAEKDVYYMKADNYTGQKVGTWTKLGTTGTDGTITLPATLEAGTYYLSCLGEVEGTNELAPAAFRLTVKEKDVIYGDVNQDGKVTSADASLILQYVGSAGNLSSEMDIKAGDVNGDKQVTSADASLVLQRVAGSITSFPVE